MTVSWVPSSWDAVKTGQLVRVQNGDQWAELEHWSDMRALARYAADGWDLFVPAPATPPLPTDPGTVISWAGGAYLPHLAQLDTHGKHGWWTDTGDGDRRWYTATELSDWLQGTPYDVLAPVATTAKKFVLAYNAYSSGTNRTLNQLDQAVRDVAVKEFGAVL